MGTERSVGMNRIEKLEGELLQNLDRSFRLPESPGPGVRRKCGAIKRLKGVMLLSSSTGSAFRGCGTL